MLLGRKRICIVAALVIVFCGTFSAVADESKSVSNTVSIDGKRYRLCNVGDQLALEVTDTAKSEKRPVRFRTEIRPPSKCIRTMLATWGTSERPLMVGVTTCKHGELYVYHAVFFDERVNGDFDSGQCFAMSVTTSDRLLSVLSINASFKTDSAIIVLGEFSSIEYIRAVERGVIWMCDCPNIDDVGSTLSSFEKTTKKAKVD